jgi:dTDP-glucose pyrophosphorylase
MQIKQLQNLIHQQNNISCLIAENNNFSAQKLANTYHLQYQALDLFFTYQVENPLSYGLKQMAKQIVACL